MHSIRFLLPPVILAAALAGLSAPAAAQHGWELNSRLEHINERIDRSEARGRISHREARNLREELRSIRESERRMKEDGHLDPRERQTLERRLNRVDKRLSDARR